MGLGAGFKVSDWREKEKERLANWKKEKDNWDTKSEDGEGGKPMLKIVPPDTPMDLPAPLAHTPFLKSGHLGGFASPGPLTSSHGNWSATLYDWFCRGPGHSESGKPGASSSSYFPPLSPKPNGGFRSPKSPTFESARMARDDTNLAAPQDDEHLRPSSPSGASFSTLNSSQVGPYELLIKERMMGIYLTVFVHRDILPLVQGDEDSEETQ